MSVDHAASLKAFSDSLGGLPYPLLSDFHPKGTVLESYGAYNQDSGTGFRSVFIIDKDGLIRWSNRYAPGSLPEPAELLLELDKIIG